MHRQRHRKEITLETTGGYLIQNAGTDVQGHAHGNTGRLKGKIFFHVRQQLFRRLYQNGPLKKNPPMLGRNGEKGRNQLANFRVGVPRSIGKKGQRNHEIKTYGIGGGKRGKIIATAKNGSERRTGP